MFHKVKLWCFMAGKIQYWRLGVNSYYRNNRANGWDFSGLCGVPQTCRADSIARVQPQPMYRLCSTADPLRLVATLWMSWVSQQYEVRASDGSGTKKTCKHQQAYPLQISIVTGWYPQEGGTAVQSSRDDKEYPRTHRWRGILFRVLESVEFGGYDAGCPSKPWCEDALQELHQAEAYAERPRLASQKEG